MKFLTNPSFAVLLVSICLSGCQVERRQTVPGRETLVSVSREQAVEIARTDATRAYRDLSGYEPVANLGHGVSLIEFQLKDRDLVGGGPSYVIDAETGEVLSKKYHQ